MKSTHVPATKVKVILPKNNLSSSSSNVLFDVVKVGRSTGGLPPLRPLPCLTLPDGWLGSKSSFNRSVARSPTGVRFHKSSWSRREKADWLRWGGGGEELSELPAALGALLAAGNTCGSTADEAAPLAAKEGEMVRCRGVVISTIVVLSAVEVGAPWADRASSRASCSSSEMFSRPSNRDVALKK